MDFLLSLSYKLLSSSCCSWEEPGSIFPKLSQQVAADINKVSPRLSPGWTNPASLAYSCIVGSRSLGVLHWSHFRLSPSIQRGKNVAQYSLVSPQGTQAKSQKWLTQIDLLVKTDHTSSNRAQEVAGLLWSKSIPRFNVTSKAERSFSAKLSSIHSALSTSYHIWSFVLQAEGFTNARIKCWQLLVSTFLKLRRIIK